MRASAASHLSQSHATTHAAQTNHNNKPDETSPFAQLMDSVAPQDRTADKKLRNDARAQKPADDKAPAAPQDAQTEAKAADQDNKPVASDTPSDTPDAKAEEKPATGMAEDVAQTAMPEPGDAAPQIAQTAPQPDIQTGPSLLAALNGDMAQTPDASSDMQTATPDASPAIGDVQLAAATAQNANTAKPGAPATGESAVKAPQTGEVKTPADQKPEASATVAAANDNENAAPQTAQPDTAPVTAETAAKPAPQTASTNMAVQAPVAQPHAAAANANNPAPQVAQHVDVSATPKPNMTSLAVEISAKSQSGAKQFDIRLDPPELGRVEVRLSIDATGKASAHLSADQPQTLDLLQKDASILTRALRDAGLDMSQSSLNFSLRQQAQGQQGGEQRGHGRASRNHLTATQGIEATSASATYRANGGIDIRV